MIVFKKVMENYDLWAKQLDSLLRGVDKEISKLANASAFLFNSLEDVSWVGFYLLDKGYLYLGPFQGKVACTVIPIGKGVCGTAVANKETILVKNVHEFPGHIACDSESNSEIVIPIYKNKDLYMVLDIDSKSLNRFSELDKIGLEKITEVISENL